MHYTLCTFVMLMVGMRLEDTKSLCITKFMHYYIIHYKQLYYSICILLISTSAVIYIYYIQLKPS